MELLILSKSIMCSCSERTWLHHAWKWLNFSNSSLPYPAGWLALWYTIPWSWNLYWLRWSMYIFLQSYPMPWSWRCVELPAWLVWNGDHLWEPRYTVWSPSVLPNSHLYWWSFSYSSRCLSRRWPIVVSESGFNLSFTMVLKLEFFYSSYCEFASVLNVWNVARYRFLSWSSYYCKYVIFLLLQK